MLYYFFFFEGSSLPGFIDGNAIAMYRRPNKLSVLIISPCAACFNIFLLLII